MSKIRLDYSWAAPEVRKGIQTDDPTPEDLAITQDDFKKIGAEKFQKIQEMIRKETGDLDNKTEYVLMSQTGNTLLLSKEGIMYNRNGDNVGTLSVDWASRSVNGSPSFGFGFQLESEKRLCAGKLSAGIPCDILTSKSLEIEDYRFIYPNTLGFRIFDHTPPQVGGELMTELGKMLGPFMGGMSTLEIGTIEGKNLLFPIPEITRGDARHRLSIFADGVLLASPNGDKEVSLPIETKEILLRVTDPFGNAREFEYSFGLRQGEKAYFIGPPAGQKERIVLFQAHIRRLIQEGYIIKVSDVMELDPLNTLVQNYSDRLFSKPDIHTTREILLPVFGFTSLPIQWSQNNRPLVWLKKVTDWLTGEELAFLEGSKDSPEKMLAKIYEGHGETGIPENLLPPGEARKTPPLVTWDQSGKPDFPESFPMAKFRFVVRSEMAWGRSPHEPGGGNKMLEFTKTAADLIEIPLSIQGRLEAVLISFPAMWSSTPENAEIDVEANPKGYPWKTTDRFGNTIFFGDKEPALAVLPHFSPNNGKTLNIDLTGFGLGTLSHLVAHERVPPTGKIGSHHQYDLYSSSMEDSPSLQQAIRQVEEGETDFGFVPGTVIRSIRVVEESEVNASVRLTEPDEIRFNEGILELGDGFPYVGFHEACHSIDAVLEISDDPKFDRLFKEVGIHNPAFLSWISEFNFLPDALGGHAWDGHELFPALINSQFHPDLKGRLAQSDPKFVETYHQFLETTFKILKERAQAGKIPADAPVFGKLENLLLQSKDIKIELPLPLKESEEFEERKLSRLLPSRRPSLFGSASYLFRKDGDVLTGGAAFGLRIESDLFPIAPLATSGSLILSPYAEANLNLHWKDSWVTLMPEAGLTLKKLRLVGEYPLLLGAGYAFEYMPFQGHRTESGAALSLTTNLPTWRSNDQQRVGLVAHYFPRSDDLWIALQFSRNF